MSESKKRYYKNLEELYYDNYKLVYIIAGDYVANGDDRNEASSSVWAKIAAHPEKYLAMDEYRLKNYMRVMIKNICMDRFREAKKEAEDLRQTYRDGIAPLYADFGDQSCDRREMEYLSRAAAVLTIDEKQLIWLRFKEGLNAKEIGRLLEISDGNVRVRQKRILDKLRKEILRLMKEDDDR